MAELALHIGDNPSPTGYKDGDILHGFNDTWIQRVHAEHISKTQTDLRVDWCNCMCQFRFERLSQTEMDIVQISDGARHRVESNVAYDNPFNTRTTTEQIDIAMYIMRRRHGGMKFLGGTPGKEIWWGGRNYYGVQSCVDDMWTAIEAKTAHRRTDPIRKLWPAGRQDLRGFLFISTDDFTPEQRSTMEGSEERETKAATDTEPAETEMVQKRIHRVNWKDELGISSDSVDQIRDSGITIDKREQFSYERATVVKMKTEVVVSPR